MIFSTIKVAGQLTRLDTCTVAFLSVALPLWSSTGDLRESIIRASPILTISMCGFVINDLHDIAKDEKNHPGRPLPSGQISPVSASILYFSLLTISLILVKTYVELRDVYLYLVLLIGLINYNYVVFYVPTLKNLYVASVGIIPVLILGSLLPAGRMIVPVIASLFLFIFGREMLMDVEDRDGDGETLIKKIGVEKSEYLAFGIRGLAALVLSIQISDVLGLAILLAVVAADLISFFLWKRATHRVAVLLCMKLQLLAGIYYLM
jgi:geranylgeranylglycerol-phosphate geranylgeranyltransferase